MTQEFQGRVFACGGGGEGAGLGLDALGIFPRFIPASPTLGPFRCDLAHVLCVLPLKSA